MTAVPAPGADEGASATWGGEPDAGRFGPEPTANGAVGGPVLTVGYAVVAVACAAGAWWLARRGVATDLWPPFVQGTDDTTITRYSGAWLTAAAGAALVAALLLVTVVRRLLRTRRARSGGFAAVTAPVTRPVVAP